MSTTFVVDDVQASEGKLPTRSIQEHLTGQGEQWSPALLGGTVESVGANASTVLSGRMLNGFLNAVHTAYDLHYPLVLSPDDIWLTIAQGFASHVLGNAEGLRERFLPGSKAGEKEYIEIQRNEFVKGSLDNDWPGCFDEFSEKIGKRIGEHRTAMIRSNFSTTGVVERAASEVVLMESMSAYFEYGIRTACGIPTITLMGTTNDWKDVVARAGTLGEYELAWWVDDLLPVLQQFVAASEGSPNRDFWKDFYKLSHGGSGGPFVTGWINQLFPYMSRDHRNHFAYGKGLQRTGWGGGPNPDDFPAGLSKVPFKWYYFETTYDMEFVGGFVGACQNEDGSVRPAIGWAVRDENQPIAPRPYSF